MKKIFFVTIIFLLSNNLKADVPYYLDFNYILNESVAGKKAQTTLKKKLEIYSEIHADLPKFRIYYQMNEDIQGDRAACAKPPVDFKTKVPLWPGEARPG